MDEEDDFRVGRERVGHRWEGKQMTGVQLQHFAVFLYSAFWLSRIRGVLRRCKQVHLRGSNWFLDVPVTAAFYEGPGQRILWGYWLRMAIPFVLDVPAIAMIVTGHSTWLMWLIVAMVPVIHLNHIYNVNIAERQAWKFAKPEAAKAAVPSTVGLSLTPRRLRDYMNWTTEWILCAATVGAGLVLVAIHRAAPEKHDLRLVFWVPAFYLYLQLGILLVKRLIVAWRAPVPTDQTAEYLAARDAMRRYYLRMCDWNRIGATASIVFWAVLLSVSHTTSQVLLRMWLGAWLAMSIAGAVWVEIRRKQLAEMSVKVRPVRMPDLLGQQEMTRWPVCYQPDVPMLMLQSSRGYSLNLANTVTYLGVAYLVGMVAMLLLARVQH
jgi:hypothetical protein